MGTSTNKREETQHSIYSDLINPHQINPTSPATSPDPSSISSYPTILSSSNIIPAPIIALWCSQHFSKPHSCLGYDASQDHSF
jgi:hypothetical protein